MFDSKFDFKSMESILYDRWEASGVFSCDPKGGKEPFVILMPPPNVTGTLHIGHGLNNTLQDVLVRYHRMLGRDVLWQPGTDHAGIATQSVVERQLEGEGTSRTQLGRDGFLKRIWAWKEQSGDTITRQQRRLGLSPDWSKSRFTLDDGLVRAVRQVFITLYQDGLIYKDKRLVNWDPKLGTAVSDLEVKMTESPGTLYHIRYPIDGQDGAFIVVATTRPETLFGDMAVCVHPDDDRYRHLVGAQVRLPLTDRVIPIIADAMADPEKGSGAVKITPAHDFHDFEVGRRHGLDMISVLDTKALMADTVPVPYRGLDRFEARVRVVADLAALDLFDHEEPIVHTIPIGERSGVPLEPYLTDQWYVDAKALAAAPMAAVRQGTVKLHPKNQESVFFHWMENIEPWCISRQLWWGHRIPAYYGPDGHIFVADDLEAAQSQALDHYGHAVSLTQDPDVLDTWFSSALWPFSTLGWPDDTAMLKAYYPSNVLVTGTDILFFWVARMMMMGHKIMGAAPFQDVYLHALVRDASGQKMSKSKGNIVDPLEMIDTYGADAMRFGLCALSSPGREIKFSAETVELYRNFSTKLWNVARFCDMNGAVYDPAFDPRTVTLPVNQWIVSTLWDTAHAVSKSLESFRFDDGAMTLYQFIWGTVCDWYVELLKPILTGQDTAYRAEAQKTAAYVLAMVCHLLHPFMPFITETIWQQLGGEGLLAARSWPFKGDHGDGSNGAKGYIAGLIGLISSIRSVRADMGIGPGVPLTLRVKDADGAFLTALRSDLPLLTRLGRLSFVDLTPGAPSDGSAQLVLDQGTFLLPLQGIIDWAAERKRLEKSAAAFQKEIDGVNGKLTNQDFCARAPEDVIQKAKTRRDDAQSNLDRIQRALAQLTDIPC